MPNLDCGAYFLTTLIPVKVDPVPDPVSGYASSPAHLLRSALAKLAPAMQEPFQTVDSPFARNLKNHFVRLVLIEDFAYVGRKSVNPLITVLSELFLKPKHHINPVVAQAQDHLSCPFLLFTADFDAESGDAGARDAYLKELWSTAAPEIREIFHHCVGFDEVADAEGFARYIARCQIETTMPFHDYFPQGVPLKENPDSLEPEDGKLAETSIYKYAGVFFFIAALVSLFLTFVWPGPSWLWPLWVLIGCVAGFAGDYALGRNAGGKSYPPAQNATLPDVLKALYLKEKFARFAIDNQFDAAAPDGAQHLQARFKDFLSTHRPQDVAAPTQAPGTIEMGP